MEFDIIQKKKIKNAVEMILHTPGNYKGGILEMTIVIDCKLDKEYVKEYTKQLVITLKNTSEVFRNVRLNTVLFKENEIIENEVSSLAMLQLGSYFEKYNVIETDKDMSYITAYLKKFHARSKLIIYITNDEFLISDKMKVKENLEPFLRHKLLIMRESELIKGSELWRNCFL